MRVLTKEIGPFDDENLPNYSKSTMDESNFGEDSSDNERMEYEKVHEFIENDLNKCSNFVRGFQYAVCSTFSIPPAKKFCFQNLKN